MVLICAVSLASISALADAPRPLTSAGQGASDSWIASAPVTTSISGSVVGAIWKQTTHLTHPHTDQLARADRLKRLL